MIRSAGAASTSPDTPRAWPTWRRLITPPTWPLCYLPAADIDHRGTPFTDELLNELLTALTDPATGRPCFGQANFEQATFSGDAVFEGAKFDGDAWFRGAEIGGIADFGGATFSSDASFREVGFTGGAWAGGAEFRGDAGFFKAEFERATGVGPLVCTGTPDLSESVFQAAVRATGPASAPRSPRSAARTRSRVVPCPGLRRRPGGAARCGRRPGVSRAYIESADRPAGWCPCRARPLSARGRADAGVSCAWVCSRDRR
ncbi:pentapeptide repeat-containing protein [Streptomyces griseofuscus]|uniref:pentapeptide repeat-containing protein n=1 Tax=Streptomyces griseofuscus TaxID=146922 RepID=UPI003F50EDBA